MRRLLAAGERSASVLTATKLANVALSMLWGFAVTYVFVRALPAGEFRAFLLLVAFNNFTISAEFGFTTIIYARLRRHWLAMRSGKEDRDDDFRPEEIGVLVHFLAVLIVAAGAVVALLIALGWIPTGLPGIFLIFFLASALNVLLLLAKRALAALDHNLLWEVLDIARRMLTLGVLLAVLAGLPLLTSVTIQLILNLVGAVVGMALIHRWAGMRLRHWLAIRVGGGHIRRNYMHDIGASAALTLSEITAYNGPYFVISAISHDPALLLVFDFAFKMMRAVATAIRATIEGALPHLTRLWFGGGGAKFGAALGRAVSVAIGVALCADLLLIAVGERLFLMLYHGTTDIWQRELLQLCVLQLALAIVCASVYVQGALGRFMHMLKLSLPFLAGSLLAPAIAALLAEGADRYVFMPLYAVVFIVTALAHGRSMARLRGRTV
ncbi:MAG: hypothetical protein AB7U35_00925 [Sphingobium sp.]